jgi:hypothetical protein
MADLFRFEILLNGNTTSGHNCAKPGNPGLIRDPVRHWPNVILYSPESIAIREQKCTFGAPICLRSDFEWLSDD